MADILTLAQARAALGWTDGQNPQHDTELAADYIPTVTGEIVAGCGRMEDRRESWETDNASPITTPWPTATIKTVTVGGSTVTGWTFVAGVLTITDPAYTAGDEVCILAADLPTPPAVTLAAKIILAHLWNTDKQGRAPASAVRGDNAITTPPTFIVPRRAEALLAPYRVTGGFA